MAIAEQMRECLTRAFRSSRIEVIDERDVGSRAVA